MRVEIDGVVYVPASEAFANAKDIERALVSMWWGDVSTLSADDYDNYVRMLKVLVSDSFDSATGDPLQDVVAEIATRLRSSTGDAKR